MELNVCKHMYFTKDGHVLMNEDNAQSTTYLLMLSYLCSGGGGGSSSCGGFSN